MTSVLTKRKPTSFTFNSGDWQSTYVNSYFPKSLVMEAQDYYGNRLAGVEVTFSGPTGSNDC